jgi:hypothetical protein
MRFNAAETRALSGAMSDLGFPELPPAMPQRFLSRVLEYDQRHH